MSHMCFPVALDDDDLLDLLSDGDGDDAAVRKRTKPRTPSLEQDGKPITSVAEERPRSGRGSDDRRSDVVESSAEQKDIQVEVEKGHKPESSTALKDRKVESFNSSLFGDDLLSGMGLADSGGSKVSDLLGNVRKPAGEGGLTGDVEEEGYRFGGYSPSVASLEKPPSGIRRGSEGDSLTSRPSSAPSTSVKKSVRFADTVETSDRPSSSPAVGQGRLPHSSEVTRGARRRTSEEEPAGSEVSSRWAQPLLIARSVIHSNYNTAQCYVYGVPYTLAGTFRIVLCVIITVARLQVIPSVYLFSMQPWEERSVSIDKSPAAKDPQDGSSSQEQPSEIMGHWQQSKPSPEAARKRWSSNSQGTIFAEHHFQRQEPLRLGREQLQGEARLRAVQERVRELEGQLQKETEDCRQRQVLTKVL